MLYLLYGTDFKKVRKNLHSLVGSLLKRKPDANVFSITAEDFSIEKIEELIASRGLFSEKYIVVLDKCFEDKNIKETLSPYIKDMSVSENLFVVVEDKLDAKTKNKLEKYAEQSKVYDRVEKKKKTVNPFAITESLGRRDKKSLWVEYTKAIQGGSAVEEVHGILLWQIRSMMLARDAGSAEEAGLKPFVYAKAKGFLRNYPGD